jgi:hypothetical protein
MCINKRKYMYINKYVYACQAQINNHNKKMSIGRSFLLWQQRNGSDNPRQKKNSRVTVYV